MKEVLIYDDTYDVIMSTAETIKGKPQFAQVLWAFVESYAETLKDIDSLNDHIQYLQKELNDISSNPS